MPQTLPGRAANPASVNWRVIGMGALIVWVTIMAYLPALGGKFIWNDSDYVTEPALRPLSGLVTIWAEPGVTEQYYPLLHSFFWVQHQLWGDNPFCYHVVTLLLHATAAVLFALILRRLAIPGAWFAGLLFAVHPVHVESVAWITEQKNTLSLVFYLGAALAYLRFDETRQRKTYFIALGLFVLALLSKTVTASLPAALLVIFWWKRGRLDWRRDWQPLLGWFALGLAGGLFSSWVEQHYFGAKGADFDLPMLERGLVAGRAICFYLGKLLWPFDLNFIYPKWTPDAAVWWQWLFPLGVLALVVALWVIRKRSRAPLAAFLFFAGSLFPVLGFVNLYGALYSFVWDHWQYLPNLGPIALIAASLTLGWKLITPRQTALGVALAGLLVVGLGTLTWNHSKIFRDDPTLYRATLAANPECWMAHYNLGNILVSIPEQLGEALDHYEETLRFKPNHAGAHSNLGNTLANFPEHLPEAILHLREALKLEPNSPQAHYNLGTALAKSPTLRAEAVTHFESAINLDPNNPSVHYNLGNVLLKIPGRQKDAIAQFETALRLNPQMAQAHYNLGIALLNAETDRSAAINHFETALRIKPDFEPAREILQRLQAPAR